MISSETFPIAAVPRRARIKKLARSIGLTLMINTLLQIYLKLLAYFPGKYVRVLGLRVLGARIGGNVLIYYGLDVLNPWRLTIGKNCNLGFRVVLDARGGLTIGENCNISTEAAVWTGSHDLDASAFVNVTAPVVIGSRVWLSFRSVVLPGVTIGEGAVVSAGAVVRTDVPPFAVVAGVPARIIGWRNRDLSYSLGRSNGVGSLFL
jgi:acetyltransferase-like isoleucine patch superfamily enzyme